MHLVGNIVTYCKMMHGAYSVTYIWLVLITQRYLDIFAVLKNLYLLYDFFAKPLTMLRGTYLESTCLRCYRLTLCDVWNLQNAGKRIRNYLCLETDWKGGTPDQNFLYPNICVYQPHSTFDEFLLNCFSLSRKRACICRKTQFELLRVEPLILFPGLL